MVLFRKPSWLKPEINEFVYWVHLGILAAFALGILQILSNYNILSNSGVDMFTLKNVLLSIPILAISDIFAHTTLGLN